MTVETFTAEQIAAATAPESDRAANTWAPLDLSAVVAGDQLGDPPALLRRTDATCLLYRGKLHALSGEPEAGKGWLALHASAERLSAGDSVLYVDFEDTEVTIAATTPGPWHQWRRSRRAPPLRPPRRAARPAHGRDALEHALSTRPTLAVIDGVTEALAIHGLSLKDNDDIAKWLALLPRPLAATGAAVVLIDHVTKDREARGRYAIGAQHKLAGVDVAYTLESVEPFGRGRDGLSKLIVTKDRPGYVRQHSDARKCIAEMRLHSQAHGSVEVELLAAQTSERQAFRPTVLMERVSVAIEQTPGMSSNARSAMQSPARLGRKTWLSTCSLARATCERKRTAQPLTTTAAPLSRGRRARPCPPCPDRVPTVSRTR